jgi:hypothetical protein
MEHFVSVVDLQRRVSHEWAHKAWPIFKCTDIGWCTFKEECVFLTLTVEPLFYAFERTKWKLCELREMVHAHK